MNDSLTTVTDTLIYNAKLGKLNPIFIPEAVPFEPIAPGWYALLGLIILLFFLLVYRRLKIYQSKAYRRKSAAELLRLKSSIGKTASAEILQNVATVLKTTAMLSYSREKVAGLHAIPWKNFLISTSASSANAENVFELLQYQYASEKQINKLSAADIEKLIDVSVKWIRRHHV